MASALDEKKVRTLLAEIQEARIGQKPLLTTLSTSDRVLRRVTDGIYREPWSALRELISNAYDADATEVVIDTDAPRFDRVSIRDNGMGFTAEALALMIKSIGGSSKRTETGGSIGVTETNDPFRSPKGRKLIGKLGIGLFAVSQLTNEFQVITKRSGDDFRTIADVVLFRYSENRDAAPLTEEGYTNGTVQIWKVPARDKRSQGTEVVLRNLWKRTRDDFASRDMWESILAPKTNGDEFDDDDVQHAPPFHIGRIDPRHSADFQIEPRLPWGNEKDADKRFRRFAQSMFNRADDKTLRRPSLFNTFDNYLKYLWYIGLATPLDYLDLHPFDLTGSSGLRIFKFGDPDAGRAEELTLRPRETIRDALQLKSPERGSNLEFRVVVDNVSLKRPIRFAGLPKSAHAVDQPLLFIGTARPDLSKYPDSTRGGELAFEAYFLWSPRVVPVEHNGVLIRVNDASGTLFDPRFMDYQVSELQRLQQVTAEVFVTEGVDAALNIDRESFNAAHPHYQYLKSWVHSAFRQLATRHKDVAKTIRTKNRATETAKSQKALARTVESIVDHWTKGDEDPVEVDFTARGVEATSIPKTDRLTFALEKVFSAYEVGKVTAKQAATFERDQAVMRGITQVLYAAGLLDRLSHERQQRLLSDLAAVIFHGGDK